MSNQWFIEGYSLDLKDIISNVDKFKVYTLEEIDLFKLEMNRSLKISLIFQHLNTQIKPILLMM